MLANALWALADKTSDNMEFVAKDNQTYTITKMKNDSIHKSEVIKMINDNWEHVYEPLLKDLFEDKYSFDGIPANFVVEKNGKLIGNCSLLRTDLLYRSDIFPFFGNCYVEEKHRRKGIMSIMQDYVCTYAKGLGFKQIYLWTNNKKLYENLGWEYLEDIDIKIDEKVHLFCKILL